LASLYKDQGRYREAESLCKRALEESEQSLGRNHAVTLAAVSNLASLYEAQGRFGEAEPLLKRAIEDSERINGMDHPNTFATINNLAILYEDQGRYGEAEPLLKGALERSTRMLGGDDPHTITVVINLGLLYKRQHRYDEAETQYKRALDSAERVQGKDHRTTLISADNLAGLYEAQGRYVDAEPLRKRALDGFERVLGRDHPETLIAVNNLANLYQELRRYAEAEVLYNRVLEASQRVWGKDHPYTLTVPDNLAGLYVAQGRYADAERLRRRALEALERVLGPNHPDTLICLANLTGVLVKEGKTKEALQEFRRLDDRLAFWLDAEITNTEGAAVRRRILEANSIFQNAMFSFAVTNPSDETARFAADLTLRWKKRLLQDDAYLANLMRISKEPKIVAVAQKIRDLRQELSAAALAPKTSPKSVEILKQDLEAAEADLRLQSQEYRRYSQAKHATAQEVQNAMPRDAVLIEYRLFKTIGLGNTDASTLHLLATVLKPDGPPALKDLGQAGLFTLLQHLLIDEDLRREANISLSQAQRVAYDELIAPLKDYIAGAKTLILSPDGPLNALPFDSLSNEKGEPLLKAYTIRLMQTGRDLVARDRIATGKGLVAFGGIDFGTIEEQAKDASTAGLTQVPNTGQVRAALRATQRQLGSFDVLKYSGDEVDAIAETYGDRRSDEPKPAIYKGLDASKGKLRKALAIPPRVLHLATHGFYLRTGSIPGQPLLQSGVALAGANKGLSGKIGPDSDTGILLAIETSGLNLVGTELVVLSACQTGQGVPDYSEGLEGLPSAFYVAGAKNVLVALWNVDDEGTKEFMKTFYDRWTLQPISTTSDPAKALQETKSIFMSHPNPKWRNPQIWAAFVLFEG
jgi:CHAT domain-containing protein/Tfp pilus assembly protein PilF